MATVGLRKSIPMAALYASSAKQVREIYRYRMLCSRGHLALSWPSLLSQKSRPPRDFGATIFYPRTLKEENECFVQSMRK